MQLALYNSDIDRRYERTKAMKHTAIYVRVSSNPQKTRSQLPDLKRWIEAQGDERGEIKWYTDKFTGKAMNRPAWDRLQAAIESSKVSRLVVWKTDRLGRTTAGLARLYKDLLRRKVGLISVTEGFDLTTPSGKLVAHVMASVAEYDNEVRSERIRAGQAAAKAEGKTWGGSTKGRLHKFTLEQARQIITMKRNGEKVSTISRTTGVNRQAVYRILKRHADGDLKLRA